MPLTINFSWHDALVQGLNRNKIARITAQSRHGISCTREGDDRLRHWYAMGTVKDDDSMFTHDSAAMERETA